MDALNPILLMLTGEADMQILFCFDLFHLAKQTHYWFANETKFHLWMVPNSVHSLWLKIVTIFFSEKLFEGGVAETTQMILYWTKSNMEFVYFGCFIAHLLSDSASGGSGWGGVGGRGGGGMSAFTNLSVAI